MSSGSADYPERILTAEPVQAIRDYFQNEWYPIVFADLHPLRKLADRFYDDPLAAPFRRYIVRMDQIIQQALHGIAARAQATFYFRLEHEPIEWYQRHNISFDPQEPLLLYKCPNFRALAKSTANRSANSFKSLHKDFFEKSMKLMEDEAKALAYSDGFERRKRGMDTICPPRESGVAFFAWMLLFGPPVGQDSLEDALKIRDHVRGVVHARLRLQDLIKEMEHYWTILGSLDHDQISELSSSGLVALREHRRQAAAAHIELSNWLMDISDVFVGYRITPTGIARKTDIPGWPASLYSDLDLNY